MPKMIEWKIKKIPVANLKEYKGNPRTLMEKGMEDLKKSIVKFGFPEPIVVNPDMTIIGGHARKKTLEALDIKEVAVMIPDKILDEEEVKELNIRLNKNIAGEFDSDMLANNYEMEDLIDWGFDKIELGMIDGVDFPELADGDKEPFQQMTFTLSDDQAETVKKAIDKAKKENSFEGTGNENSNGNAIYFVAASYL